MGKPGELSYGPYEHNVETYYDPQSRRWLACRWGEYRIGPHGRGDSKQAAVDDLQMEIVDQVRQDDWPDCGEPW